MNDMTDILDLPAVEFKLNRKDILQKLWSQHAKHPSAADHAIYFALWAALCKEENREPCLEKKLQAAFTPITNKVKLANGARPDMGREFARSEAHRTLGYAYNYKKNPGYKPQNERNKIDWTQHAIDRFTRAAQANPFLAQAINFCTLEEIGRATDSLT